MKISIQTNYLKGEMKVTLHWPEGSPEADSMIGRFWIPLMTKPVLALARRGEIKSVDAFPQEAAEDIRQLLSELGHDVTIEVLT